MTIYLDYAASTPVDPAVAAEMARCLADPALAANPAALGHAPGRAAAALVDSARAQVAALINASPGELVFTSGATEADNLAILGAARFLETRGRHLITALTEHRAVLECCRHLAGRGWQVTWLRPDASGIVSPEQVARAFNRDTVLVSLMHVNNELGVIQDVGAIGALCRARDVLLHVDAAQSAGRVPIDVRAQGIDLLSLSAHKIHGPKGVGALFLDRERVGRVEPLMYGGGQERGLRPGTVATHQVAGMGVACRLARERLAADRAHVARLHDRLRDRLLALPGVELNGDPVRRTGHILNVSVAGVEGESLLAALGELAVASGSACASLSADPSYVLRVIGRSPALARSAVRFSLGRPTTEAEVDTAASVFAGAVAALRRLSPAWPPAASQAPAAGSARWNARGEAGSMDGGAWVVCRARVAGDRLDAIEVLAFAGPALQSACRALEARLPGQPVGALRELGAVALREELGLPACRAGDLLVLEDALRNCLADWENARLPQLPQGSDRGGHPDR